MDSLLRDGSIGRVTTDHRFEELSTILGRHAVFGLEPARRAAVTKTLHAAGWDGADLELVIEFAQASGRRRIEKTLHDLERENAWAFARESARQWRRSKEAEEKGGDRDAKGWNPDLRNRDPKRLTHTQRLELLRRTFREWSPDSLPQLAVYLGVESVDEVRALIAEADVELTFRPTGPVSLPWLRRAR